MRSRRRLLTLLGTAAAAAAALPIVALAAPGAGLPDLRADAPEGAYFQVYGDGRLLLRFDGFVTNVGAGPLDLSGNPQDGVLTQRQLNGDGSWTSVGTAPVRFESADSHNHWHLMRVMEYSLRRSDSLAEAAPSQKVGFCLYDISEARGVSFRADRFYDGDGTFCDQSDPGSTSLRMGVSAGWRDDYGSHLTFQWVDVSGTTPGSYRLASEADPNNVVRESNESNPLATIPVRVPGFVAQGFSANVPGRRTTLSLQAATVTASHAGYNPDGRQFTITDPPDRGTLSAPNASGTVVYTPNAGYVGPDSFGFVARDGRGYPRGSAAPAARATLSVAAPQTVSVGVSGAPASLIAGTSAQLSASVVNADGDVTWSIDGDPGGALGAVSASGLYVAPGAPPSGPVTVRATSVADPSASGTATIAIAPVAAPVPAPIPVAPVSGAPTPPLAPSPGVADGDAPAGRPLAALTRPRVARNGRTVLVRVAARRAGTLSIAARRGATRADQCVTRLSRGKGVVCRLRVSRGLAAKPLRVVVLLKGADGSRTLRSLVVRA